MSSDAPQSKQKSTRDRLTEAMIRVIGSEGMHAASVRTVAREAGCNEAVLYQHFPSKAAMQEAIYEDIVSEMAEEKRRLATTGNDVRTFIRSWIEVTYHNYDQRPDAFAYALLTFPPVVRSENPISDVQSRIFIDALASMSPPNEFRIRNDSIAIAVFRSTLLGIPYEIHMKRLDGPASDYAADVAQMAESIILQPI
jgi:AcrR family transcriptional regulator